MALAFRVIEHAAPERLRGAGVGDPPLHFRPREAGKLDEKFAAPLFDQAAQLALVIGKKQKRRGGGEFLALEQKRNARQ